MKVILANTAKIRKAHLRKLAKARSDLNAFQELISRHRHVDVPEFRRWIATNFGPLQSQIHEVLQQITANEILVNRIECVALALNISNGEAYGRVMDERAGETAIPASPPDDNDGDDDGDDEQPGKKSHDGDPDKGFGDFVDDFFGSFMDMVDEAKAALKDKEDDGGLRKSIQSTYRSIAKLLHPDCGVAMTEDKRLLWQRAQDAYESGNLGMLEQCLAECGGNAGLDLEPTVGGMLAELRGIRNSLGELRSEVRALKRTLAWGFTTSPNIESLRKRTQESLEDDLLRASAHLGETESFLEFYKARWEAFQTARTSPKTFSRARRPRRV